MDGGSKRNAKEYLLTKNGRETGVFKARNIQNANLNIYSTTSKYRNWWPKSIGIITWTS